MNMENFKTIVLINLVVISLFLTFNLWTYVPDSNSMQNTKFVEGTTVPESADVSNVILPSSVIVHKDNKRHFVSEKQENINLIYNILKNGELQDWTNITSTIPKSEFLSYVHGEGKIEIVFPTTIPFGAIRSVLSIKDKKLEKQSFDRIIIDPSRSRDQNIDINFVAYNSRQIYRMTLKDVNVRDIVNAENKFVVLARPYFEYRINNAKSIFLPDGATEKRNWMYITSNMEIEAFKNALFSDSRYATLISNNHTDETYTDGIRSMQIKQNGIKLEYTNSSITRDNSIDDNILVQKSFEFLNGHNGITDNYRFVYVDPKGETKFRLYENDLPVFNKDRLTTIKQIWGSEGLISYQRPLFKFAGSSQEDKVILPPGHTVIQSLANNPDIDKNLIQNIGIGYKFVLGNHPSGPMGTKTITGMLKPIWYVEYGEDHMMYEWSEEKGGSLIGLE
ncbi:YycH family regulatory protein [Bacillus cytotoxicus]|uniref:YycH family regulatory protein n=1 Tax=Bacillus cytotoxicus TaxID=580165 RepID=UPI003D7CCAF1